MPRLAGRRRAALGTLVAAALLAAAACNGDGEAAEDATTTERSTTTTTEPDDPFAVPDDITEAYVQRVLDELYRIEGDALRLTVDEGLVTEEVLTLLRTAYSEAQVRLVANSFSDAAISGFENVIRPPGNTVVDVEEIVRGSESCIFVRTTQDASKISSAAAPPAVVFVELTPTQQNVTGWHIEDSPPAGVDDLEPEDPCD